MQEEQSIISRILSESVAYTVAELHVHGALAAVVLIFRHAVSEDHIAITAGSAMVGARIWFVKHKQARAIHLDEPIPVPMRTARAGQVVYNALNGPEDIT